MSEPPRWLTDEVRRAIHEQLPGFLRDRRWFAGKARIVDAVRFVDETPPGALPGTTVLALVEVAFRDGAADAYFLPLAMATGAAVERLAPGDHIARVAGPDGSAVVFDALADDGACEALLGAIQSGRRIPTLAGWVHASTTSAFAAVRGPVDAPLTAHRGAVEQSNTNITFGDRLLLKVFRRLEPGLNPELEIGRFLAERTAFDRVPQTAGAIEYERPGAEPVTLAILQGLVVNQGTGWEHALGALAAYYPLVSGLGDPPEGAGMEGRSPLEVAAAVPPPEFELALDGYALAAATLGRRTAELHLALAGDPHDPAFAPEPLTEADLEALARDVRHQVETSLGLLRTSLGRLAGPVADQAQRVLEEAPGLLEALDELPSLSPGSTRIRLHGDYHLGQVLRTAGDDFVILDFEGEPAHPLARRRAKQTPLKDVVGMLRSYDYAAWAGLFAFTRERPGDFERLAPWALAWQTWTAAAFLRQYLATAAGAAFLPAEPGVCARLLAAFTLDKALYELLYELNNRPDWVRIPLHGILALIERGRGGPASPRGGSSP